MGNHITASDVKFVKLNYTNGISTLVGSGVYNSEYIESQLREAIAEYERSFINSATKWREDYVRLSAIFDGGFDEYADLGIVWKIDFVCNYNLDTAQQFATASDRLIHTTINVGYDYDLGENETIEEIEELTGVSLSTNQKFNIGDEVFFMNDSLPDKPIVPGIITEYLGQNYIVNEFSLNKNRVFSTEDDGLNYKNLVEGVNYNENK